MSPLTLHILFISSCLSLCIQIHLLRFFTREKTVSTLSSQIRHNTLTRVRQGGIFVWKLALFVQWRIQDFPQEEPIVVGVRVWGVPMVHFAKFSEKPHEMEKSGCYFRLGAREVLRPLAYLNWGGGRGRQGRGPASWSNFFHVHAVFGKHLVKIKGWGPYLGGSRPHVGNPETTTVASPGFARVNASDTNHVPFLDPGPLYRFLSGVRVPSTDSCLGSWSPSQILFWGPGPLHRFQMHFNSRGFLLTYSSPTLTEFRPAINYG